MQSFSSQNLQTMSANCFSFWGSSSPRTATGALLLDPDPLGYSPPNENSFRCIVHSQLPSISFDNVGAVVSFSAVDTSTL